MPSPGSAVIAFSMGGDGSESDIAAEMQAILQPSSAERRANSPAATLQAPWPDSMGKSPRKPERKLPSSGGLNSRDFTTPDNAMGRHGHARTGKLSRRPKASDSAFPESSSTGSKSSSEDCESSCSENDATSDGTSKAQGAAVDAARHGQTFSFRQLDTVSGTHVYTIRGFQLARGMGSGGRLCSDYFEVSGQHFRLEVYPGGSTADNSKYVSVYLTTPFPTSHYLRYEICVVDQSGGSKHFCAGSNRKVLSASEADGIIVALPQYVEFLQLHRRRHRYLRHDTVVLRAKVDVLHSWRSVPAQAPPELLYPHDYGSAVAWQTINGSPVPGAHGPYEWQYQPYRYPYQDGRAPQGGDSGISSDYFGHGILSYPYQAAYNGYHH
mmetsp:Transcript_7487/g.21167  ORF Transcript_7487/g.21167 Transcript_7487/m.21167 type:complete len:382 (+) Transcript_7487:156-1301(+)|eukprot:CAMPEP_0117670934 /NCGR_PEP_ID=MMETSP0804-20121206/13047_1 /TAXON_ID=1074897 /ORGANISM="Tetraselmis astigmatica, Strain CCMP880" /LENGTH=381 /DNA_ID=CAMNT_0005479325 /DNA_START=118 /DNA_END=1263 /DNA_ORIENTATION=-